MSPLCFGMFAADGSASELVQSCTSLGIVICATVRRARAVLIASSTTFWTCAGPITLVVSGDVHEEFVQVYILLIVSADQIMERMAGDREHWLAVALGVVQPV